VFLLSNLEQGQTACAAFRDAGEPRTPEGEPTALCTQTQIAFADKEIAFANEEIAFANEEVAFANEEVAFANEEVAFANEEVAFWGMEPQERRKAAQGTASMAGHATQLRPRNARTGYEREIDR